MRDYAWAALALTIWGVCVRFWGLKVVLMAQCSLAALFIVLAIALAFLEKGREDRGRGN
jgi:hypothetical protein